MRDWHHGEHRFGTCTVVAVLELVCSAMACEIASVDEDLLVGNIGPQRAYVPSTNTLVDLPRKLLPG